MPPIPYQGSQSPSYGLLLHPPPWCMLNNMISHGHVNTQVSRSPSTSAGERYSLPGPCWGSKHLPGSQSQPPCTGLILLAWQHKQQLSAGSYGECCFTSVSGIRPLKTPAKGLMSLAPRCDILLQALPVRYRKPDLSGETVISRSLRGWKANHRGPALLSSRRAALTFLRGYRNKSLHHSRVSNKPI